MSDKLIVGTVGYPVKKSMVYRDVDFIEITDSKYIPPGKKMARKHRSLMPASVSSTVLISKYFHSGPKEGVTLKGDINNYGDFKINDQVLELWNMQIEFAKELESEALILVTPPKITPTSGYVKRMSEFLKEVPRNDFKVVWQPHGPWEHFQSRAFAESHDLILAVDPLRDEFEDNNIVYFRLGPFAALGSTVSLYDLEQIIQISLNCNAQKVYCSFETSRALDDVRNIKKLLTQLDDESEFEDEFEF